MLYIRELASFRKIKQTKAKAAILATTTRRVVKNGEQFVQAASLLIIVAFTYHGLREIELNKFVYYTVLTAGVIIGIRGFVEFVKFLDADRK